MNIVEAVQRDLLVQGSPQPGDVENLQRFFKVQPGQYGENDAFLGIKVPPIRRVAAIYKDLSLEDIAKLAASPWHEIRLTASIILANRVTPKKTPDNVYKAVYNFYLQHAAAWNNWDIVDLSCRQVVGGYLLRFPSEQSVLQKLAGSKNIWERRIAIVSTWQFIREGKLDQTFKIAEQLLKDNHDLIHKATGWMLREAGKRDEARLKAFLGKHASRMPRTMLRYALERLSDEDKKHYMTIR